MTTGIETHPSETGGTTSKTQSGRLPVQPVAFLFPDSLLFLKRTQLDSQFGGLLA